MFCLRQVQASEPETSVAEVVVAGTSEAGASGAGTTAGAGTTSVAEATSVVGVDARVSVTSGEITSVATALPDFPLGLEVRRS